MRTIYRHRVLVGIILLVLFILPVGYGFQGRGFGFASLNTRAVRAAQEPQVSGPFVSEPVTPYEFTGDLRDLPAPDPAEMAQVPLPLKYAPGTEPKGGSSTIASWHDPIAQTTDGAGEMPSPIANFAGMSLFPDGGGWPPDTNGDVGPTYYIQTVNMAIAIYNKTGGQVVAKFSFDAFFNGTGTPCDTHNDGDPVVVYDRLADRWLITDFSIQGPYYECMAISKTGDPVSGGWWMYGVQISATSMNDYPKFGVWPDAYYMSTNMFLGGASWDGVQVWAFNRQDMLAGHTLRTVHFSLGPAIGYGSLLPSHMLSEPPAGSPNYFASVAPPDQFQIWKFHVDWGTPTNSAFTGPTVLTVADFAIAASVPQPGSTPLLDSLSYRPMMQLQYRKIGGVESLWLNHTVASQGVGAVRWYEVRDPGGTPALFQQGTYQPDQNHRWMGALAVDKDGNMAVGYSVSSSTLYPAIRYAGRLAGEIPGLLTQGETSLIAGSGSQTTYTRWGDYSGMAVDPVDDCTFWYTTEYYLAPGGTNWQTRIGSFKFPSCGQPKGFIEGTVRNAVTNQPIPNVPVLAEATNQTLSVLTDQNGYYHFTVLSGSFDLTAGPLLPGYPNPVTVSGVNVTAGNTTHQDMLLTPVPYLTENGIIIEDSGLLGDGDGYPEPGEQGILLHEGLENTGAITATNVTAQLSSLTTGVTIDDSDTGYADIGTGTTVTNTTPLMFSLNSSVVCGENINFRKVIHTSEVTQTIDFSLNASTPLPRANIFNNDVESGSAGWTTGGTLNFWGITTSASHSPTRSWADSPGGLYFNNANSYLRSPSYNLTNKRHIQVSGWFNYDLEAGYDYVYLEYSLDGGTTWNPTPLAVFNGYHTAWEQVTVDAFMLDDQPNIALRFHFISDPGVVGDGIYIDDVVLSYEPFDCDYVPKNVPGRPRLQFPQDNGFDYNPVIFVWEDSHNGYSPTGYALTVDTSVFTYTTPITSTTMTLPLGPHTWSVRAFDNEGSSLESDVWSFDVLTSVPGLPGAPTLLSPADHAVVFSPFVLFRWVGNTTGGTPDGYILTLDGTDVFTSTTRVDWVVLLLTPGTHTWSVRAYNGSGESSPSQVWTVEVPYLSYLPLAGKD